jgi:hypothetical protein
MSGRIVGEVLDHAPEDLRGAEFLTLLAIAEDASDKDRRARFSDLENLTRRTRQSPGTIRNALSTLARRGLIIPIHRARPGTHQEYLVAELYEHHRHTTVSRPDDTNGTPTSHPPVTPIHTRRVTSR